MDYFSNRRNRQSQLQTKWQSIKVPYKSSKVFEHLAELMFLSVLGFRSCAEHSTLDLIHAQRMLKEREIINISYQPGDGTAYHIVLTPLQDSYWVVSYIDRGASIMSMKDDFKVPGYIEEKLGVTNRISITTIAWLLNAIQGLNRKGYPLVYNDHLAELNEMYTELGYPSE